MKRENTYQRKIIDSTHRYTKCKHFQHTKLKCITLRTFIVEWDLKNLPAYRCEHSSVSTYLAILSFSLALYIKNPTHLFTLIPLLSTIASAHDSLESVLALKSHFFNLLKYRIDIRIH